MRRRRIAPLPTLEDLGLTPAVRRLGDQLVERGIDRGGLADEYCQSLDYFAKTRRLYCPRCGELLCVDLMADDDEEHFRASCVECSWPGPYETGQEFARRWVAAVDALRQRQQTQ